MEDNWFKIFSSIKLHEAEIVKAILSENEITSIIINKKDSSYQNFGEVEVFVNISDADLAQEIINQIDFE